MKKSNLVISITVVSLIILVGTLALIASTYRVKQIESVSTVQELPTSTGGEIVSIDEQSTEAQLLYLIEEEKLAHDVYTVMYQKYGAKVFGNILESETTHQGKVLVILQARSIADPRSSQVGVFKNQELQALYNQLVEQGNMNETEAYKAGVIIEEKDIADISAQLATTTDQDVIDALEILRKGSESHLRAFNRQL